METPNGNSPVPFEGAKVRLGPFEAKTDEIGKFSLPSLNDGMMSLYVVGDGHRALNEEIRIRDNGFLSKPVIMYAEGFLSGDIVPINEVDQVAGIDTRKPFERAFNVYSSDGATRIRYHHDKKALSDGRAQWQEIRDVMSYNFTGSARQILHVQFANSDLSRKSEMTFYSFFLDPLGMSQGFFANDGSGRIFTRDVELTIDVPPTADKMRIAQSAAELQVAAWEAANEKSRFVLRSNLDLTTGTINANGVYEMFLQFADVNGNISQTYRYIAFMELFPVEWRGFDFAALDVFNINDGMIVSNKFTVGLNLIVPPNAVEVAIFEGNISLSGNFTPIRDTSNIWLDVTQQHFYNFEFPGAKKLFVRYRDADHAISPTYAHHIYIDPTFDLGALDLYGFDIDAESECPNQAILSDDIHCLASRNVEVTLKPPVNATKFIVIDGNITADPDFFDRLILNLSNDYIWQTLPDNDRRIEYYLSGVSVRNLRVYYKTADDVMLPYYSKEVYVDASLMDGGDFSLVDPDGDYVIDEDCVRYCVYATVNDSAVYLRPRLPSSGESVANVTVFVNDIAQSSSNVVTNDIPVFFSSPGTYYVQVKYTSADGNLVLETDTKEIVYQAN